MLQTDSMHWQSSVSVVDHPMAVDLTSDDIVILAMKTQDTFPAIQDLSTCAPSDLPICCAQNGVENERIALRLFENVYGMYVMIFGSHLAAGVVQCFTSPSFGVLDLGRYPRGKDKIASETAQVLTDAGFDSVARPDIMRWKQAKLIDNLGNALAAGYGDLALVNDLYEAAKDEGRACYRAAGIEFISMAESEKRREALFPLKLVNGKPFPGGSAWQSLARGARQTGNRLPHRRDRHVGSTVRYFDTINAALQRLVRQMATLGIPPASLNQKEFRARLAAEGVLIKGSS